MSATESTTGSAATESDADGSGATGKNDTILDAEGLAGRALEAWKMPPVYRRHPFRFLLLVAVVAVLAPLVAGGNEYRDGLLDTAITYAILTLGFYWCFSLAGQFTFGVFGLYATGAYVSVWTANHFGGFWSGLIGAILVTTALGALTRLAFARSSMIFFAIATMATGGLLLIVFRQWTAFTGGYDGVSTIAVPSFFGRQLATPHARYFLMAGVLVFFLLLTALFLRSPGFRDLTLARDKAPVAAAACLRPRSLQLAAFAIGSGMQGAAGSLYAHNSGYFSLESFSIDISLLVLLMLLLGGLGSMYGPVLGAVVLTYLPELLRDAKKYADLIYAIAVLAIVILFPTGIAGLRAVLEKSAVPYVQKRWGHARGE